MLSEYALDEKNNYRKYFNVVNNNGLDELIMGHCEIVLTERCTLRCKDCANLIQYYKNHVILIVIQLYKALINFWKQLIHY